MSGPDVHPAARSGFALASGAYTGGRPGYPREMLTWLRDRVGLGSNKLAIELGAGTGKFTRLLLETGATLIAIEPVEEMRAHLVAEGMEATVMAGSARAIPVADASADAVACAQSFHWFATHDALDEIHRVLKPGGILVLVWNIPDETVPWVRSIQRILAEYASPMKPFHGCVVFSGSLPSTIGVARSSSGTATGATHFPTRDSVRSS